MFKDGLLMQKCRFSDEGGSESVREKTPTEHYLMQYFADRDHFKNYFHVYCARELVIRRT